MAWVAQGELGAGLSDPELACSLTRRFPGLAQDGRVKALFEDLLLREEGLTWEQYSACPCCGDARTRLVDGWPAFLAALQEEILPDLQDTYRRLASVETITRLHTRISPDEMTTEPTFTVVRGLAAVPLEHSATWVTECAENIVWGTAHRRLELANGEVAAVALSIGRDWQYQYAPNRNQPAARRVIRYDADGTPKVVKDNGPEISAILNTAVTEERRRLGPPPTIDPKRDYCAEEDGRSPWDPPFPDGDGVGGGGSGAPDDRTRQDDGLCATSPGRGTPAGLSWRTMLRR